MQFIFFKFILSIFTIHFKVHTCFLILNYQYLIRIDFYWHLKKPLIDNLTVVFYFEIHLVRKLILVYHPVINQNQALTADTKNESKIIL